MTLRSTPEAKPIQEVRAAFKDRFVDPNGPDGFEGQEESAQSAPVKKDQMVSRIVDLVIAERKTQEAKDEEDWQESLQSLLEKMHDQNGAVTPSEAVDIDRALATTTPNLKVGAFAEAFPAISYPVATKFAGPTILCSAIQSEIYRLVVGPWLDTTGYDRLFVKAIKDPRSVDGRTILGTKLYASFNYHCDFKLPLVGKVSLVKQSLHQPRKNQICAGKVAIENELWLVTITAGSVIKESPQCTPAWMVRTMDDSAKVPTTMLVKEPHALNISDDVREMCKIPKETDIVVDIGFLVRNPAAFQPGLLVPQEVKADSKGNWPDSIHGWVGIELTRAPFDDEGHKRKAQLTEEEIKAKKQKQEDDRRLRHFLR